MGLLDFLKKPGVRKTLRVGQAVGKVLRKKVEDRLDESEAKAARTSSPSRPVEDELSRNLEQFRKFHQTSNAIGFMAVDFFAVRELEKTQSGPELSPEQAGTLGEALTFLRQCNAELEKVEVRKDGFVKGNLSQPLLDKGENVLQKSLELIQKEK